MAYSVAISEPVKGLLEKLAATQPTRCRELALLLLSLEKNPEPAGSRELHIVDEPTPGERIWIEGGWEILYRLDRKSRCLEVGCSHSI